MSCTKSNEQNSHNEQSIFIEGDILRPAFVPHLQALKLYECNSLTQWHIMVFMMMLCVGSLYFCIWGGADSSLCSAFDKSS